MREVHTESSLGFAKGTESGGLVSICVHMDVAEIFLVTVLYLSVPVGSVSVESPVGMLDCFESPGS